MGHTSILDRPMGSDGQKTLASLSFSDMRSILAQLSPGTAVDDLVDRARIRYEHDDRHLLPHLYVIEELLQCEPALVAPFTGRLRNRVYHMLAQARRPGPELLPLPRASRRVG